LLGRTIHERHQETVVSNIPERILSGMFLPRLLFLGRSWIVRPWTLITTTILKSSQH